MLIQSGGNSKLIYSLHPWNLMGKLITALTLLEVALERIFNFIHFFEVAYWIVQNEQGKNKKS